MSSLTNEELEKLNKTPGRVCSECDATIRKNYCRKCDLFFWEGHKEDCSSMKGPYSNNHKGHRTY